VSAVHHAMWALCHHLQIEQLLDLVAMHLRH
jgi:hypothetical protein